MATQERSCRGFVSSRRKKYLGNFHSRIPGAMNGVVAEEYSLSLLRKPSLQPGPDNRTRKLDVSYRWWRKNRTGVRVFGGKFLYGSAVAAATGERNRLGVPTYPLDHNNIVRLGFSKEISGVVGRGDALLSSPGGNALLGR